MTNILPEEVGEKYAERVIEQIEDVEKDINEFGLSDSVEPYDVFRDDQLAEMRL